jgi:hypothetical protein
MHAVDLESTPVLPRRRRASTAPDSGAGRGDGSGGVEVRRTATPFSDYADAPAYGGGPGASPERSSSSSSRPERSGGEGDAERGIMSRLSMLSIRTGRREAEEAAAAEEVKTPRSSTGTASHPSPSLSETPSQQSLGPGGATPPQPPRAPPAGPQDLADPRFIERQVANPMPSPLQHRRASGGGGGALARLTPAGSIDREVAAAAGGGAAGDAGAAQQQAGGSSQGDVPHWLVHWRLKGALASQVSQMSGVRGQGSGVRGQGSGGRGIDLDAPQRLLYLSSRAIQGTRDSGWHGRLPTWAAGSHCPSLTF